MTCNDNSTDGSQGEQGLSGLVSNLVSTKRRFLALEATVYGLAAIDCGERFPEAEVGAQALLGNPEPRVAHLRQAFLIDIARHVGEIEDRMTKMEEVVAARHRSRFHVISGGKS